MQVAVNGTDFFYLRYGRGVPLVVVHGGPGLDHTYFRPYLDALGHVAELIYIDLRGNGRSGGRAELQNVTIESWADDIEALRQALRLDRIVLMGHSFGGFIAQAYARAYPASLRGLILSNATPALDYPAHMLSQARDFGTPEQLAALMASMARPAQDDQALRRLWKQSLPMYFFRYQPMFGAAMDDAMVYSAAAYNRGLFELTPQFNSVPWLREITAPTILMASRHDWLSPIELATHRLRDGIAGAQAHLFENSGHFPFIEETTAFCHTIRQWLKPL
jgi:proline iminopeptidase